MFTDAFGCNSVDLQITSLKKCGLDATENYTLLRGIN
jgi:hypothetical protein